jgi:3-hydroxy-9,10-secoandrosta-1,3,5(10)-triene-9,17-dione monooxygenase reductase component
MSVDPADFRRALGQFAAGVTVVTTRDAKGRSLGLTVTAFSSVSLDPPLVLVCVDHRSEAHVGFRDAGLFGVSILAEGQQDLSKRFAVGGAAKFKGLELPAGHTGVPLIPGAVAHLECRVKATHEAGDHRIYVGEVLAVNVNPGRPLLYHDRDYRKLS